MFQFCLNEFLIVLHSLSARLSICLSVFESHHLSIYLFLFQSAFLSVCTYIFTSSSICPSVYFSSSLLIYFYHILFILEDICNTMILNLCRQMLPSYLFFLYTNISLQYCKHRNRDLYNRIIPL